MKRSETALVLSRIAAIDNRRLDPPDSDINDPMSMPVLNGWHELIGDLDARDVLAAVANHRRTSGEYLTPFHVIKGVKAIREARLKVGPSSGELMADVDPNLPGLEYNRIYRERIKMVADGNAPQLRAIQGGVA